MGLFPITGKRTHDAVKGSTLAVIKDGLHRLFWIYADQANKPWWSFWGGEIEE